MELVVSERLKSVGEARAIAELDGVEGISARDYFDTIMRFNKSGLVWDGRKRHPAPDPLNALLSLTYTLLMHELGAVLEGLGLDPYLGFLHQLDYGRQSLALVRSSQREPSAREAVRSRTHVALHADRSGDPRSMRRTSRALACNRGFRVMRSSRRA